MNQSVQLDIQLHTITVLSVSLMLIYQTPDFLSFWLICRLLDVMLLNSLQNNKIVDWSNMKAFADNKNLWCWKIEICFGKKSKHNAKRRNAGCQHFLLFPSCFQQALSSCCFFPDCLSKANIVDQRSKYCPAGSKSTLAVKAALIVKGNLRVDPQQQNPNF